MMTIHSNFDSDNQFGEYTSRGKTKFQTKRRKQWFVLAAGFSTYVLAAGFVFNLSIFYSEWLTEFGKTNSETSLVQSICAGAFYVGGFASGMVIARYGPVKCGTLGGIIAAAGLMASFFASSILIITLCLGASGLGLSFTVVSATTGVAFHFEGRVKIMALAFIVFGAGVGISISALVFENLMSEFGWRGTLLIESGILLNLVVNSAFFSVTPGFAKLEIDIKVEKETTAISSVKNEQQKTIYTVSQCENNTNKMPELRTQSNYNDIQSKRDAGVNASENKTGLTILKRLMKDKLFVFYALTLATSVASFSSLIIFLIDYYVSKGISRPNAVRIYFYMHITNTISRLIPGFVKMTHTSVLVMPVIGTLCGCISAIIFPFIGCSYVRNIVVACVFGSGNGIIISSITVTTVKLLTQDDYAVGIGTCYALIGIFVGVGGPISGHLRDTTGDYSVLFVSASVILILSSMTFLFIMAFRHCSESRYMQQSQSSQTESRRSGGIFRWRKSFNIFQPK